MRRHAPRPTGLLLALLGAAALAATATPLAAQDPDARAAARAAALFDSAYAAWDAGDYDDALARLDRLLAAPGAGGLLADVAVLTGERYRTVEVAPDGTNPRWSPDGRHAAYDVPGTGAGADAERRTVVVAVRDGAVRPVAELAGRGAVFSPDGARIAWLRTADPAALAREEAALRERIPVQSRADFVRLRDELTAVRARHARVRVRDLTTGRERDVRASEPVHAVVWSGGEAVPWIKGSDVVVSPTGTHLVFQDDEGLALLTIATGFQRTFPGSGSAAFSADGSTLAFLTREGREGREGARYALRRVPVGTDARLPDLLLATTDALASPALSADGSVVALQRMGRENWEVWVAEGEGEPRRLTHDVQHDLFPRFLAGDRLLVIKGEGRHRRSYVYPARPAAPPAIREWVPGSGEGMRLFHNNTVRTVAPEYEWAVSPDGTMVLTVAERDGDTITPDRGVYLTDLGRPVTLREVRARVREQLAAERALRRNAGAQFAGIVANVREAVADVSVSRIHGYAADLFRFGSKHITQPGNALAIDYLAAKLRSFGYDPELQWFEPRPGIRSANVIARLPGTAHPDVAYVVGSHFDSVERGPGADDNSSGTTALLEAARVLAGRPQPATIEFVFFTGEEAGLLGSREYARRAVAEGKRVAGALNNDMVGYANDDRLDNTIRYSSSTVRDLQHAAALLFTDLILYDAHYYKSTDAHALFDAFGDVIGGIGSYPILANPHYHQEHDVLETIDQRLVAEVSKATVASVMGMARGDSPVSVR
ncbi:MAG TPA: M20/M25/M40 family metallo-hydrolase [Longimicrobiales bacterium]|nr:M20/M25/M40 family metallo-hydrolase [Longimicrobiales bacterium]